MKTASCLFSLLCLGASLGAVACGDPDVREAPDPCPEVAGKYEILGVETYETGDNGTWWTPWDDDTENALGGITSNTVEDITEEERPLLSCSGTRARVFVGNKLNRYGGGTGGGTVQDGRRFSGMGIWARATDRSEPSATLTLQDIQTTKGNTNPDTENPCTSNSDCASGVCQDTGTCYPMNYCFENWRDDNNDGIMDSGEPGEDVKDEIHCKALGIPLPDANGVCPSEGDCCNDDVRETLIPADWRCGNAWTFTYTLTHEWAFHLLPWSMWRQAAGQDANGNFSGAAFQKGIKPGELTSFGLTYPTATDIEHWVDSFNYYCESNPCQEKRADGEACDLHTDCASSHCNDDDRCETPPAD